MKTAREVLRKRTNWRALVAGATGTAESSPHPGPLAHYLHEWATAFGVVHQRKPMIEDYPAAVREFLIRMGSVKPKRGRPRFDEQRLLAARRAWESVCCGAAYSLWHDLYRHLGGLKQVKFSDFVQGDCPSETALANIADQSGIGIEALRSRILRGKDRMPR
jgi:hypothetical protein